MYKLITSAQNTDDLSKGFDRDGGRRQRELTNNNNTKGKHHVTVLLKDFFGFLLHQGKGTYGLGYKLTLTRHSGNAVLNKGNAINNAKIKIRTIDWYVPDYTPPPSQEKILISQIYQIKTLQKLDMWKGLFL